MKTIQRVQQTDNPIDNADNVAVDCGICLAALVASTAVLPCGHTFHHDCVVKCRRHECPFCSVKFHPWLIRPNFALEELLEKVQKMGGTDVVQTEVSGRYQRRLQAPKSFVAKLRQQSETYMNYLCQKGFCQLLHTVEKYSKRGEKTARLQPSNLGIPFFTSHGLRVAVMCRIHEMSRDVGLHSTIIKPVLREPTLYLSWELP